MLHRKPTSSNKNYVGAILTLLTFIILIQQGFATYMQVQSSQRFQKDMALQALEFMTLSNESSLAARVVNFNDEKLAFELWLINKNTQQAVVTSSKQFKVEEAPSLFQISSSRQIISLNKNNETADNLIAVEKKGYYSQVLIDSLWDKLLFLFIYVLVLAVAIVRLRKDQKKNSSLLIINSDKSQRAEQALSCIDEVVITTNLYGRIVFCNASTGKWLGNNSMGSIIGKHIQKVFPFPGMPWLDKHNRLNNNGQIKN